MTIHSIDISPGFIYLGFMLNKIIHVKGGGDKEGECANLEKVNIVSRIHVRQSKAYHQLSQTKRQLQMEKPGLK